ncbi:MAG: FG-GAP-like repeat-containing protein [Pyrinomonadaceae bacterium]
MRALPGLTIRNSGGYSPMARALMLAFALICAIMVPIAPVHAQGEMAEAAQAPAVYRPRLNFTGDTKTDFALVNISANPSTPITWKVLRNPAPTAPGAAFIRYFDFGTTSATAPTGNDVVTSFDYDGNGFNEIVIWRAGVYYSAPFPESGAPFGALTYTYWGGPPSVDNLGRDGDYDGDGKVDYTTVRLSGGFLTWIINLSTGGTRTIPFGRTSVTETNTFPYPGADFTGDGRDELVYCTTSTSTGNSSWYIGDAVTGAQILGVKNYGNWITDYFLQPDDYNGDGKADIVVMRSGGSGPDAAGWFIRDTATGQTIPPVIFGIADPAFTNGDVPCRGNYDGDQKADICVWRPSTSTFYWLRSSDGVLGAQQWGVPTATEFPLAIQWVF